MTNFPLLAQEKSQSCKQIVRIRAKFSILIWTIIYSAYKNFNIYYDMMRNYSPQ
jgi:hypothetical protein